MHCYSYSGSRNESLPFVGTLAIIKLSSFFVFMTKAFFRSNIDVVQVFALWCYDRHLCFHLLCLESANAILLHPNKRTFVCAFVLLKKN